MAEWVGFYFLNVNKNKKFKFIELFLHLDLFINLSFMPNYLSPKRIKNTLENTQILAINLPLPTSISRIPHLLFWQLFKGETERSLKSFKKQLNHWKTVKSSSSMDLAMIQGHYFSICYVCFESYDENEKKPKTLSCSHTVCLRCIRVFYCKVALFVTFQLINSHLLHVRLLFTVYLIII